MKTYKQTIAPIISALKKLDELRPAFREFFGGNVMVLSALISRISSFGNKNFINDSEAWL